MHQTQGACKWELGSREGELDLAVSGHLWRIIQNTRGYEVSLCLALAAATWALLPMASPEMTEALPCPLQAVCLDCKELWTLPPPPHLG